MDPDGNAPRTNASSPSQAIINLNASNMIRWIREKEPSFALLKNVDAQGRVQYNQSDIEFLQHKLREVNGKKTARVERLYKRHLKRMSRIPTSRANIGTKRDKHIPKINLFRGKGQQKIRQEFYENENGKTMVISRHEADEEHPYAHFHSSIPMIERGTISKMVRHNNGAVKYQKSNQVIMEIK